MAETPIHHHNMTKKRLQRRAIHSLLGKTKKVFLTERQKVQPFKTLGSLTYEKPYPKNLLRNFRYGWGFSEFKHVSASFWKDDFVVIYIIWSLTSKCLKKRPPQKKKLSKRWPFVPIHEVCPQLAGAPKASRWNRLQLFCRKKSHQIRNHRFPPNH